MVRRPGRRHRPDDGHARHRCSNRCDGAAGSDGRGEPARRASASSPTACWCSTTASTSSTAYVCASSGSSPGAPTSRSWRPAGHASSRSYEWVYGVPRPVDHRPRRRRPSSCSAPVSPRADRRPDPAGSATGGRRRAAASTGLALAYELAAARCSTLGDGRARACLDERLRFLRAACASPIGISLRDAITWSYDLLSAGDQALLRRVPPFRLGTDVRRSRLRCTAVIGEQAVACCRRPRQP